MKRKTCMILCSSTEECRAWNRAGSEAGPLAILAKKNYSLHIEKKLSIGRS